MVENWDFQQYVLILDHKFKNYPQKFIFNFSQGELWKSEVYNQIKSETFNYYEFRQQDTVYRVF